MTTVNEPSGVTMKFNIDEIEEEATPDNEIWLEEWELVRRKRHTN